MRAVTDGQWNQSDVHGPRRNQHYVTMHALAHHSTSLIAAAPERRRKLMVPRAERKSLQTSQGPAENSGSGAGRLAGRRARCGQRLALTGELQLLGRSRRLGTKTVVIRLDLPETLWDGWLLLGCRCGAWACLTCELDGQPRCGQAVDGRKLGIQCAGQARSH